MTEEFDQLRRSRARAYLEHVRDLRERADALQREVEIERQELQPKGMRMDAAAARGCAYADAIPDGLARIELAAERSSAAEREYAAAASEAREAISAAGASKGAAVLSLRYIYAKQWGEVAADCGCSERTAQRLHDAALLDAYEAIPLEWRIPRHAAI